MKKLVFIVMLVTSSFMYAQVGIGNTNPQASLDISSSSLTTPSNTDGLLIPRIDDFPLTNPTITQDGMMVFVTGTSAPTKGFYYWNHDTTNWVSVTNGGGTLDEAYDKGGAGAGRIITADTGAMEIQDTGGLRVEGDIVAAENIIHDGDANTFIGFTDDRVEIDAGGTNYMNIQHANSRITFNEDSNELDFRIESGANQNIFFVDGSTDRIGIGTNSPGNLLHIGIRTTFDTNVANAGQDGIFIRGSGTTGINEVGGSISFGGAHPVRDTSRRAAIASMQTGNDEDNVGLAFYVHGGPINTEPMVEGMRLTHNRRLGIGRAPATNALEVEGEASKTTAGAFIANSDRRLKKNIQTLKGKTALEKIEKLRGVTYLWNDNKTGSKRPEGIQYGFIAQEIQEVFPEKVTEDNLGYLQTAYGDYDALFVQAIKEQQLQITKLSEENKLLKLALDRIDNLEARLKALEPQNDRVLENVSIYSEEN